MQRLAAARTQNPRRSSAQQQQQQQPQPQQACRLQLLKLPACPRVAPKSMPQLFCCSAASITSQPASDVVHAAGRSACAREDGQQARVGLQTGAASAHTARAHAHGEQVRRPQPPLWAHALHSGRTPRTPARSQRSLLAPRGGPTTAPCCIATSPHAPHNPPVTPLHCPHLALVQEQVIRHAQRAVQADDAGAEDDRTHHDGAHTARGRASERAAAAWWRCWVGRATGRQSKHGRGWVWRCGRTPHHRCRLLTAHTDARHHGRSLLAEEEDDEEGQAQHARKLLPLTAAAADTARG